MSKKLFLVRHTESVENTGRETDIYRLLTPRGYRDASRIGGKFLEKYTKPDVIVSSPAERAIRTAELMAEQMKFDLENIIIEEGLYEASARTLLNIVSELNDGWGKVLLVGHNPSFSYFAEYMTKQDINNIAPGGIVEIDFDVNSWKEVSGATGVLISYEPPVE